MGKSEPKPGSIPYALRKRLGVTPGLGRPTNSNIESAKQNNPANQVQKVTEQPQQPTKVSNSAINPTAELKQDNQVNNPEIKSKKESPRCETLSGLAPEFEQLGENIFAYTYSGLELSKQCARKGSLHAAQIDLPWGGKALLFERLAPGHEAQDSLTLVVDWQNRTVRWAKSDGVTTVHENLNNQSATLATSLTKKLTKFYPHVKTNNLDQWHQAWRSGIPNRIKHIAETFKNKNPRAEAAATFECNLLTMGKTADGKKEYNISSAKLGSTIASQTAIREDAPGDLGGFEILAGDGYTPTQQSTWPAELDRVFVTSFQDPNTLARRVDTWQGKYSAEKGLTTANFTDGLKPIYQGRKQSIVGRIIPDLIKWETASEQSPPFAKEEAKKIIDQLAWMSKQHQFASTDDDISLVIIRLPKKTKE